MDEKLLEKYESELTQARLQAGEESLARQRQEAFSQPEEKSMIKEQLDLSEEIARIDYLIKGYSLEPGKDGKLIWLKPTDPDMVIFSKYGIHLIRNTVCWYLNKNLLLSNFDEATIRKKMWDFTNDLIDTIFMEYEKVFITPTVKECIEVLKDRIGRRTDITCYAREVAGLEVNREEIMGSKFKELENRIEGELEKIKQQIIKSKLKRYVLIVRTIQDAIHTTFMRAWKGQERATLRQHTHISESRGNGIFQQEQKSGGIWPWGRK